MPAALAAAVAGWIGLGPGYAYTDYESEAAPAVRLLLHGHLAGFLQHVPSYGGSLVLRAPFAAAAGLAGGGEQAAYRALAVPGLLALALLAGGLARHARARGWGLLACLAVPAVALLAPPALEAVRLGHPEEALGAVLCVAAVLAARRGRWALAGALLGAAVANKPWAVVAAGPVLLALPRYAIRAALVAAVAAAALLAPLAAVGPGPAQAARVAATDTGAIFYPAQVWWPLGRPAPASLRSPGAAPDARIAPGWVSRGARPLLLLVAAGLALLWRRRRERHADALGLLALVLFARCLLDPWNNVYYHLPFLLALLAWEVHRGRRWPVASIGAAIAIRITMQLLPGVAGLDLDAAAYLGWAVPAAAVLALGVFAPERAARLAARTGDVARAALPSLSAWTRGSTLGAQPSR